MKTTQDLKTKLLEEFREKFTVFDGSQNIVKHVTYSSWIEAFLSSALSQMEEAVRESMIEVIEQTKKTHPFPDVYDKTSWNKAIEKILESLKTDTEVKNSIKDK